MNAEQNTTVVEIGRAPILLEVHSERLLHLMAALGNEGFVIKHVRGRVNRFRILDREAQQPTA